MNPVSETVSQIEELGGRVVLHGDRIRYSVPRGRPEIQVMLAELRSRRDELAGFLREMSGVPAAAGCPVLPPGVRLIRYSPKPPPVAVQPCSIVTDVDKFIRSYLRDLHFRLEHPEAYACAPLREILAKLAEVGVELETDASHQR